MFFLRYIKKKSLVGQVGISTFGPNDVGSNLKLAKNLPTVSDFSVLCCLSCGKSEIMKS